MIIDVTIPQCIKYVGSGNPKRICILFSCNGIGDDVTLLPALWQKKQEGYDITIHTRMFSAPIFERMGIEVVDGIDEVGALGTIDILQTQFGAIYDMYKFLLVHDQEDGGTITKSRFQQCADILETTLPDKFDFKTYLLPNADAPKREKIVFAPRSYAKQRSYPFIEEGFQALDSVWETQCIGLFQQPNLSFEELIQTIYDAKCVISVDTGILHLALALETPTVAIMGGTDEYGIVYPYGKYVSTVNVAVLRSHTTDKTCQRPCSYHSSRGYGINGKCSSGYTDCMNEILPEQILETVFNLIKE